MARARRALDVWLHGIRVARLTEPRVYRYQLDFTEEALDTFGEGTRVLSLALPLSRQPVKDVSPSQRPVHAFIVGLLPEGNVRQHVATSAGVASDDSMGLLAHVGAECAGAVQFLQVGSEPGRGHVRDLTSEEVDTLVGDLPTYHLPAGTTPQASLAGIQDKVLLVERGGGSWGWPADGAVSTHLIKPEPLGTAAIPHLIQTEHWAMTVAGRAGLSAAGTRLARFGDREAIVVTRYDRTADGRRTHQEDFCQALGLDPSAKYESTADPQGTRLRRLALRAAPRSLEPDSFRTALLKAVTFNVIIGNGDAHSKNYSLILGTRGEVSLAPLYDCAPVMYLNPRFKSTGHVVNGRTNIDWVSLDDLVEEGASWGMARRRAARTVAETVEAARSAIDATELPLGCGDVGARLDAMWARRGWSGVV